MCLFDYLEAFWAIFIEGRYTSNVMCGFKLLADQNGHIFVEIKSVRAFKIQRNDKEGIQQRPSVYLDEFKLL